VGLDSPSAIRPCEQPIFTSVILSFALCRTRHSNPQRRENVEAQLVRIVALPAPLHRPADRRLSDTDGAATVSCADHKCSHVVAMDTDTWPDSLRLSDIENRFVCQVCGRRGADVRTGFPRAKMGTA
jgi:hypothetical protein